jgi:integrase
MRGHIRERSPGCWAIVLDVKDRDGRRRRKWHSFSGTKREAQRRCAELVAELSQGGYVEPSKQTVAAYFDAWLQDWAPAKAGPKTCERYRHHARHVIAALGAKPLQQVRGGDLNHFYSELAAKGLAPPTIRHIHRLVKRVFARAMISGDVKRNPCDEVDTPTAPVTEAAVLRADEIPIMLEGLTGIMRRIAVVALGTGMRRGELCALRWQDVDLDASKLEVRQSLEQTRRGSLRFKDPKTRRGRRTITLAPAIVEELRAHRREQLELRARLGLGKPPADALVFATFDGRPRVPDNLTKSFTKAMAEIGLPHATLHSLRHTHASMLLQQGIDVLTVSRRLGHASAVVTLGTYGHVISSKDRAADVVESVLGAKG